MTSAEWLDRLEQACPWMTEVIEQVREMGVIDERFIEMMQRAGFDDGSAR